MNIEFKVFGLGFTNPKYKTICVTKTARRAQDPKIHNQELVKEQKPPSRNIRVRRP